MKRHESNAGSGRPRPYRAVWNGTTAHPPAPATCGLRSGSLFPALRVRGDDGARGSLVLKKHKWQWNCGIRKWSGRRFSLASKQRRVDSGRLTADGGNTEGAGRKFQQPEDSAQLTAS